MSREAFEKAYHEETGLYASWSPNNKGYTDVIAGMCYRMWQAAQAQTLLEVIHDDNGCPTEVRIAQAQAQAQAGEGEAVNQQLLEALQDLLAYVEQGIGDIESDEGRKARAAIAAAQENNK